MTLRIAGFAGSLSAPSKTRALVELAVSRTASRYGATAVTYDLGDLQPALGAATRLEDLDLLPRAIIDSLLSADALIVGSPVYKGSYAGLFKHLFDLVDPAALLGKPVLLTASGGGEKHALIIEHQLRPLFAFFEAAVVPTGIYAASADLVEGRFNPRLVERLDRAIEQFSPALGHRAGDQPVLAQPAITAAA